MIGNPVRFAKSFWLTRWSRLRGTCSTNAGSRSGSALRRASNAGSRARISAPPPNKLVELARLASEGELDAQEARPRRRSVAIGGAERQQHRRSGGDRHAVQAHLAGSEERLTRALVTLLHGAKPARRKAR
jgi:hypothetical protein